MPDVRANFRSGYFSALSSSSFSEVVAPQTELTPIDYNYDEKIGKRPFLTAFSPVGVVEKIGKSRDL
jgi:hypothetical protein